MVSKFGGESNQIFVDEFQDFTQCEHSPKSLKKIGDNNLVVFVNGSSKCRVFLLSKDAIASFTFPTIFPC
jgi:hypothetical protein